MSARPRPVTAASYKPKHESTPIRSRAYSPESTGDETRSLISVLDHDSIDDLLDLDLDEKKLLKTPEIENKGEELAKDNDQRDGKNKKEIENEDRRNNSDDSGSHNSRECQENEENKRNISYGTDTYESFSSEKSALMSPWEKWLVQKAKEDRRKQREKQAAIKKKKEEEEEKMRIEEGKLRKAAEQRKEWEGKKNMEERIKKKLEKQKEKTEQEVKEEEKRHVEEKAKQKYNEWMEEKRKREREQKRKEEEKKRKEEQQKKDRQEKCDRVFDEWCEKARERPKSVPSSFGYTSGKLTGYYDRAAYPAPGFYNPIPWHHPPVPRVKSEKKKPVRPKNKRWDPSKYF
ncbi:coiled-coil domain-containing protein 34-like [Lineus longissimus]|uniref:coiled-coil domain-containing protein 34-like n=1 Tax=Lineus longissimus TaxID=88925 RepID=UPI00315DA8C9